MQVRVWNDNVHVYKELFREKNIVIPPSEFVVMDYDEAHTFLGTFSEIKRDADGNPIPEGFKKLRIDKTLEAATPAPALHKCVACGFMADSAKSLDNHVSENHIDEMVDEDEVKKRKARKSA